MKNTRKILLKKGKIALRYQRVSDAKRFFEILTNKNFKYFHTRVKNIADEVNWLRGNPDKRKNKVEYNFTILYEKKVIGGIGIKINQHRKHIGEIGYFIDEKYWGKGIGTTATKLVEKFGFKKLGLKRIEILMNIKNKASEKVAIKNKYKKEGKLLGVTYRNGKPTINWLYAKISSSD